MNIGGPAWQVSVLQTELGPPEFDCILVSGRVEAGECDFFDLRRQNLERVAIPSLGRSVALVGDFIALTRLVKLLRRTSPDIVHTHTAKAGVLGRLAAIIAGVPIRVHTFHGHLLHGYFGPLQTRLVVAIERMLARRTNSLVAVGSRVRDDLLLAGIGVPSQFTVIPPGVEPTLRNSSPLSRQAFGLEDDDKVVLFVGRLTPIKRVDRLIEAFRQVVTTESKAVLLIVGDGDLSQSLQAASKDLGDRIRFVGWQANVSPYYSIADVVALTSDNEGMPVSLIEASMAGLPCVTTDVGSVREVVESGETGLVVPSDVGAISEAIVRLISNDEIRMKMGRAAQELAGRLFGTERLAEDHRRLYRRLVGRAEIESMT